MEENRRVLWFILFCAIIGITSCAKKHKYELVVLQSFYFNKDQSYQLDIDSGSFTRKKKFREVYITDKYKRLGVFKTDQDSIRVRFVLDLKDTVFTIPSNYSKRMIIGSNAYGEILIGFDRDSSFWEFQ